MAGSKFRSQVEVLSVVDKGRRRDWTDAAKVRIVEESLRGYRQCAATARRYEISRALLTRWRRDFRSGHLVADGRPQFTAVQVAAEAGAPMAKQPIAVPAAGGDDRVEITLTNGRKIALGIAVDPMTLARLVQVLDRA
jgi:transposase